MKKIDNIPLEIYGQLMDNISRRISFYESLPANSPGKISPVSFAVNDMLTDYISISKATFVESHYKNGKRIPSIECSPQMVIDFAYRYLNGYCD